MPPLPWLHEIGAKYDLGAYSSVRALANGGMLEGITRRAEFAVSADSDVGNIGEHLHFASAGACLGRSIGWKAALSNVIQHAGAPSRLRQALSLQNSITSDELGNPTCVPL